MLFNKSNEPLVKQKLIQYEFPDNKVLVHKESGYTVMQDSKLIVGPNQLVMFVRNGQVFKRFESGEHVLDTGNLRDIVKRYAAAYDGGENGIPVDLYFINKLFSDAIPWGLPNPIQINDPSAELYIKIVANGQLRYQIVDPELYIKTNMSADVENLNRLCKQRVLAHFSAEIQRYVNEKKIGYFEMAAQTVQISEWLRDVLNAKLVGSEGFKIVDFTIAGFHADDDDLGILKKTKADVMKMKREAEARAYARSVEGYTYQEEQHYNVLSKAADNSGTLGGMMGAGMGATLGMGLGAEMSNAMKNGVSRPASASVRCTNCGSGMPSGAKFCPSCGNPVPATPVKKFCTECGAEAAPTAKFCASCGKAL